MIISLQISDEPKKWSPGRITLMGRLVQIYEAAYSMSIGKNIPENFIKDKAQTLIKDLHERNKAYPNEYKQPRYAGIFPVGIWQSIEPGKEPDVIPLFPDSTPENYVTHRLTYPPTLLVKGYVLSQITVDKNGHIVNPLILKHSHPEFAEEVLKIIKNTPPVAPAMSKGIPVACNYVLYVPFRPTHIRR